MAHFSVRILVEIVAQPLPLPQYQKVVVEGLFAHANFRSGIDKSQLFAAAVLRGVHAAVIDMAPEAHFDDNISKRALNASL